MGCAVYCCRGFHSFLLGAGLALMIALPITARAARTSQSQPGETGRAAQAATPDAGGVYSVGNGVEKPTVIRVAHPEYTDIATKQKISGFCVLQLVVDANGKPRDITVFRSLAETVKPIYKAAAETLDHNAIVAVSQYLFRPAIYRGKAVPVRVKITVDFRIY